MIRELINFMNDLMSDIPDIMNGKVSLIRDFMSLLILTVKAFGLTKTSRRVLIMIISMEKIKISDYGRIV